MKITIKSKKVEPKTIINDIKSGTVFRYGSGAIALKLEDGGVVLLKYSSGSDWFELDDGSLEHQGIEILGKLDEIIVVEE